MRSFIQGVVLAAIVASAPLAVPAFADDAIKTNTMSADPMQPDPMATNTMSAEPMAAAPMASDTMKADCLAKAAMESDATKKETMTADCNAMAGGAMSADPMAPQQ
jgi:pentapeptide MXKDX repeat protein